MRLVFYTGFYDNDDYKYASHAYELLRSQETLKQDIALYREYVKTGHKFFIPATKYVFTIYVPIAFLYKMFGVNTWTSFFWPFICSLGNIVLVFFLARLIFRKNEIGLLAAGLLSFFPLSTIFATRLMPDEIANFFAGLTVLLFLKTSSRKLWGVLAGLILGVTYMVRPFFLILFLPFFIYALWKKKVFHIFLPLLTGFMIVFTLENIFFLYLHFIKGAPFIFRLTADQDIMIYVNRILSPQSNLDLIKNFPKAFFDFNFMGLFYYCLIPILLYLIFTKKIKEVMIPLVWFFYCLLFLWFLPISWNPIVFICRSTRYLNILTMPMILIMAFFINAVITRRRYLVKGLVILLLVSSFYSMTNQIYGPDTEKFNTESFRMASDILKVIPPKTLYCDIPSASTKIRYYFNFDPPFQIKKSVKLTPDVRDVYVIIHDFREAPPTDKKGIIRSIKAGEVLGGRTYHLKGEEFDLFNWELLKVIKGRGVSYLYLFYIPTARRDL